MYLRSISLKGFKSFPDRTRLEFGPGVSVIVGPNGSGKSNVTDAVLWALGEQSPVAVRGQSMQDVIFGGAPGRKAAAGAEVELVLDDSEGRLGLGTSEVSVVRRLDRSGEGEYRLAGARCRLVDVLEALSDTGLGKEMHSVISQGRVEAIVTSKARDRRLLIEEAAGLGKHRKRRRRAQLKLTRTQDNLDRALDVEREARSRLRPLKRQAEAAELHARLERQTLEVRWELSRERLRRELSTLEQVEREVAAQRQRRSQLERELSVVAEERERAEEALAARSSQREELSRRSFAAAAAGERVEYRAEAVQSALATVTSRLPRRRHQLEVLSAEHAAEAPDEAAQRRMAELQREMEALERDREAELGRQLAELERNLGAAEQRHRQREEALLSATRGRGEAEKGLERARLQVREAERAVEAARREAARLGGELAAVNQFLRSQASAPGGSRPLAEEVEVDPGYEHALAAALDGRLAAAVVGDLTSATTLLERTGADGGRVLVAPGGARESRGSGASGSPPAPGAVRLLDHVRSQGEALALTRALLADTWVVEDVTALTAGFTGVAVTRSGRVWAAGIHELRQAVAHGEERVLAERNRRERLVQASAGAAGAEHQARIELERVAATAAEFDRRRDQAVAEHRRAVSDRDEAAEEQRRIIAQIARRRAAPDEGPNAARRGQLAAELRAERERAQRVQRERAERAARIDRLRRGVSADEELQPGLEAVRQGLNAVVAAIGECRQRFDAELAADRQAGEHLTEALRDCAQREAALHSQLQASNEALTAAEVRAQRTRDSVGDARLELQELARRLELEAPPAAHPLSAEEREGLDSRLERLRRRREQLGPVNPLAQEEYTRAVEHVEELERQRGDLEAALRELQKLIADTDQQIRESFEQTFTAAAANFASLSAQLFPGGRGRLRLVSERDGPARMLGGQQPEAGPGAEVADRGPDAAAEEDALPEEDLLGVEIEITPAGKSMKRLSLLSGGEKSMTALAFLFSVFLAKPCPFYILDEVEAALDDLNIDRFLGLLREYSQRAQFIVVTHQKRTMEAADSLYGISMGTDGISKVISRRLPAAA